MKLYQSARTQTLYQTWLRLVIGISIVVTPVVFADSSPTTGHLNNLIGYPFHLQPGVPPSRNFSLKNWYLSLPIDTNRDGVADRVFENALANGFELKPLFFTAEDGGMVFVCPNYGAKTSTNTKYTRTELREMLRAGNRRIPVKGINKNNWVFDGIRLSARKRAGAVDGMLEATLKVNRVSKTGDPKKVGRIIIGQIHATNDEPLRLYYHKMPNHQKGSVYFAHEINQGDDQWYTLVGTRKPGKEEPSDGIPLNELFSYRVTVLKGKLTVTLLRQKQAPVSKTIDIRQSGYDASNQYMYFKAGIYNQNNTGDKKDYAMATFYHLKASHQKK